MIAIHVCAALKFLEDDCFAVENVLLTNKESRKGISIKDGKTITETNEKVPENETTKRTLFIKDKYNVKSSISRIDDGEFDTPTFIFSIQNSKRIKLCFNYLSNSRKGNQSITIPERNCIKESNI